MIRFRKGKGSWRNRRVMKTLKTNQKIHSKTKIKTTQNKKNKTQTKRKIMKKNY